MSAAQLNNSHYYFFNADRGNILNLGLTALQGETYGTVIPPPAFAFGNNSLSSNNWQFFSQDSVYLIRNYDYESRYQLGLSTSGSTDFPTLVSSSGDLSQQWNITKLNTGGYQILSVQSGGSQALSYAGSGTSLQLIITSADDASSWDLEGNDDTLVAADGLQYVSLQSASSTASGIFSTSTAGSSIVTSTAAGTTARSSASATATDASTSTSLVSNHVSSKGLSGGAIAGMVVGVVAAVLIVVALFFVLKKRHSTAQITKSKPLTSEKQQYRVTTHEVSGQSIRHELDTANAAKKGWNRAEELPS